MIRVRPENTVVNVRASSRVNVDAPLQGPPGPPASTYVHEQLTPSTVWVINHNLGYKPDVMLFSPGGAMLIADVVHTNDNQTQVYFALPTSGYARLT